MACSSADFLTLQDSKVKESINFKISEEEALARLDEFLFNFDVPTRGAERTIKEVIPYCPSPKTRVSSNVPDTLLYMINFDHDEGYAILAADARLDPILALIDHGNYVPSKEYINEEFNQELMDDLELDEKDDFWCSSSLGPNGSFNYRDYNGMTDLISDYGQKIIDTSPYRIAEYKDWVEKEKIGPLVRVKWNQNTPYNNMCNDNLVNLQLIRFLHI